MPTDAPQTEEPKAPEVRNTTAPRANKVVQHDEAPSGITDHPFEPRAEWWSLCRHCGLAQAAHSETTVRFHYVSDDLPDDE